jgi:aminoglycoside N3'-acetyltransferase
VDVNGSPDESPERAGPFTAASLARDLGELGLTNGSTVLVHSSLSALGYVVGGARSVVMALLEVLGEGGTLVVPTHSSELSDPRHWHHPAIPESWWPTVRESMPAYDAQLTLTRQMGSVPEVARRLPGARRSAHPRVSFCAVGANADFIIDDHRLENGFDEHSPLARLYDLGAQVLLLGVGHANNTSLHLAEGRAALVGRHDLVGDVEVGVDVLDVVVVVDRVHEAKIFFASDSSVDLDRSSGAPASARRSRPSGPNGPRARRAPDAEVVGLGRDASKFSPLASKFSRRRPAPIRAAGPRRWAPSPR